MSADLDDRDDELTVRGDIETTSVPELLRSLTTSQETGVLTCRSGDEMKSISIHRGHIAYAASNNKDERLGEILLMEGRITARQFLEASKLVRPGVRLGAILVDIGAIEAEDLIPAVEHHVRQILFDLFTWTSGDYEFAMKELDPAGVVRLNIATENLILEGVRRTRSWSQVIRALGSIETVFFRTGATDTLYRLDLTTEEQEILGRVNGRATVEQICEVSYLSHFETCRILWALQVLGVIRREQAGDAAAMGEDVAQLERELDLEEIVEKFNQMFSRIYMFLRGRVGEGVDGFMDTALDDVSRQYGALFAGVDLKHYGRADYEQMLANVADLPA
ncbi:MAG TPA: DUF4388 domain-containing protein, partial [Vicinamibacteria bacterium]|nr:DUF4388 domain-containing protein [Vicinamibacteria bacterium]